MYFDYEVTLSPDNNKKWQEMLADPEGRELILEIYSLVVKNDRIATNAIIENSYASFKEGVLKDHMSKFRRLYSIGSEVAEEVLKDYKF